MVFKYEIYETKKGSMKKTWNINDIAFIIYARYKGLQYKDIGKILGVSASSVAQQFLKLNNPSNYSKKTKALLIKVRY